MPAKRVDREQPGEAERPLRSKIRRRLRLALLGLAVLPLLAFGGLETWLRYNAALDEAIALQGEMAIRIAERFAEYIVNELESDLRVAARISGVEKLSPAEQKTMLSKLLTYKDAFSEISVLDAAGMETARVSRRDVITEADLLDRSSSDVFRLPASTGTTHYSPVYYRDINAESMMDIAIPLIDRRSGDIAAVLVASVRLQPIWDHVAYETVDSQVTTFVVDRFSRIVAHPNPSVVLRGTTFDAPSASGIHVGLDGERQVMALATAVFGERLFTVISEEPPASAMYSAYRVLRISIGFVVAALVAAGILAWMMVAPLTRRISSLVSAAQRIESGDMGARADESADDEFGILGKAFNGMVAALRGKVEEATVARQELASLNQELEVRVQRRTEDLETANVSLERSKAVLREQWENFVTILDGIPHVIYVANPETYEVLFVNKFFKDLLGADPIGQQCYTAFQGFDHPCDFCTNDRILETGEPHTWEYFNPKVQRHFLITDRIIGWSDCPQARLELAMDVTERKKNELEIQRSKRVTESIIESLPGVFYQISTEGRFVRWNGEFERVTGYSPDEISAMSPLELFEGNDKDAVGAAIAAVFEGGEAEVGAIFVPKNGKPIPYWFTGTLKELDGSPYLIGMGTDISELSQIEAELRRSRDGLERSNKELEQFAYVASHDLQEPLRMVSSYTQLLEKRYKEQLDDTAREFIAYAVDGASRMQKLINDLLSFSRVQTKGGSFETVDLNHTLGQARANLSAAIEDNSALVINDELPTIVADPNQMVSVFQNLIGNAIKFHGEEPPRIHVSASETDDEVEIRVSDNGIGIREEHQGRIFIIFQRLHNRKDYPGTGIGLALCKRIIERHGGQIRIESEEGVGTTFSFTLPKQQRQEETA